MSTEGSRALRRVAFAASLASFAHSISSATILSTPLVRQAKTKWCWAASGAMVINTPELKVVPATQHELVAEAIPKCQRLLAGETVYGCYGTGTPALSERGLDWLSKPRGVGISWSEVLCSIERGSPVYHSVEYKDQSGYWTDAGHATVGVGALDLTLPPSLGLRWRLVAVLDPARSSGRFEFFESWSSPQATVRPWEQFFEFRPASRQPQCESLPSENVAPPATRPRRLTDLADLLVAAFDSEAHGNELRAHLGAHVGSTSSIGCGRPAIRRFVVDSSSLCPNGELDFAPLFGTDFVGLPSNRYRAICDLSDDRQISLEYDDLDSGGLEFSTFGDLDFASRLATVLDSSAELASNPNFIEIEATGGHVRFLRANRKDGGERIWVIDPLEMEPLDLALGDELKREALTIGLCTDHDLESQRLGR